MDSDDEFNRHAYLYRGNASDDEEFDNELYEEVDDDEMVFEGDADEDEDSRLARISAYMRRNTTV